MTSRRCRAPFLWLAVIAINTVRCPLCQAKGETGDGASETAIWSEMVSDSFVPKPKYPPTDPCHRFSDPDFEKFEFYSPGFDYEKTYRNNTDCVLVLEAPPGKQVSLDFREYFKMELSDDCTNDYLEIRDGQRGYNRLAKGRKYCGDEFPPPILSADRHLWIHFKSDDSIEYQGFKAVFEYKDRPANASPELLPCSITVGDQLEEGNISKENISPENVNFAIKNNVSLDCVWNVTVKKDLKIQLQFPKFDLDKPNECNENFVEVYSKETDEANRKSTFCGSIADTVNTDSNVMFVRFYASPKTMNKSTFEANFTAYREVDKQQKIFCDPKTEFDCEDNTCISLALHCNGRYNCRFRWDEDNCEVRDDSPLKGWFAGWK